MILLSLEFSLMIFLKGIIITNLDSQDLITGHQNVQKDKEQQTKEKET